MKKISKNTIYFLQLSNNFFEKYKSIDEFLEKGSRGHGIMAISYLDLLIAVPLRSSLKPYMRNKDFIYPYKVYRKNENVECLKAMDFSKLLIISEEDLKNSDHFIFMDNNERQFYIDNYNNIVIRLTNYIDRYINICKKIQYGKENEIGFNQLSKYRYSTIRNFHNELGINIDKEDFISVLNERGLC